MRDRIESALRIPLPVAAGGVAVLVLFLLVYVTAMRGDGMVKVGDTMPTRDQAQALATTLERSSGKIDARVHKVSTGYEVRVPEAATNAAEKIASGSKDEKFMDIKCPKPSAFGSATDKDDYKACQKRKEIKNIVEAQPGVMLANVTFDESESGSLTGEDMVGKVTVQIMRDPNADGDIDGPALAALIAGTDTSLSAERIIIQDSKGAMIWNGQQPTGGDVPGCTPSQVDLQCQTARVKQELERDITAKIGGIVGADNVRVTVIPLLNPSSKTETVKTQTDGAKLAQSSAGSSGASNTSFAPNIRELQSTTQPGNLEQVRVSVLLNNVKPGLEDAVRDYLGNLIDVRRGDSISVRTTKWDRPSKSEKGAANTAGSTSSSSSPLIDERAASATKTLITGGFVALVAAIAAIALLWRRSDRLTRERRLFEDEFRQDLSRYEDAAQRTPEALAEEIQLWLAQQGPREGTPQP